MALERYFLACKKISILKIYMTRTSGDRKESVFEASLVAVGANFGGITSFLLGSSLPQSGRTLALLYQLEGITDGSKKMKDLFGRIEAFGGPKEVGEAVVRTITGPHPDMKGTLTESSLREDSIRAG
ncbi:hypothetical protein H0E87_023138 [Populus deltoides]|uniref:Uncharacterized protein n=1 Tax=Populus deltoides TaxID=3696 RepID=A0A8T2XBH8_POPDE|nr:hypothetical protein H0E87_023138 [Populus deltoides]